MPCLCSPAAGHQQPRGIEAGAGARTRHRLHRGGEDACQPTVTGIQPTWLGPAWPGKPGKPGPTWSSKSCPAWPIKSGPAKTLKPGKPGPTWSDKPGKPCPA